MDHLQLVVFFITLFCLITKWQNTFVETLEKLGGGGLLHSNLSFHQSKLIVLIILVYFILIFFLHIQIDCVYILIKIKYYKLCF